MIPKFAETAIKLLKLKSHRGAKLIFGVKNSNMQKQQRHSADTFGFK